MAKGKLVVFEGVDGSGKTTQSKLLLKYLSKSKIPNSYISFPRYADSAWAAMIKKYLLGELGVLDPYALSLFYAGDRMSASGDIKKSLDSGKIVVCNRYIGSNIGHMGAKIKESQRQKYFDWLEKLEYSENKIPREDLVIFLSVDPAVSKKLMGGRNLDIHEKDLKYQEQVYSLYHSFAKSKKNWVIIECSSGGKILSPSEVHQKVVEALKKRGIV